MAHTAKNTIGFKLRERETPLWHLIKTKAINNSRY